MQFVTGENPSDVSGTDNHTITSHFHLPYIRIKKKTSPVGDVLKSKAHMSDNGANPLSVCILPYPHGLISYQNRYQSMSVPSAFLPPAGGVFNAVPSR
ncbi:hypothetical protein NIHE141904_45490 [Enterobacter hormaechei]|nr:hypothetical protein NIHE141904_45490 [Enterobacter hormaechei]